MSWAEYFKIYYCFQMEQLRTMGVSCFGLAVQEDTNVEIFASRDDEDFLTKNPQILLAYADHIGKYYSILVYM